MNETILIIKEGKSHKVTVYGNDGNLRLTLRIHGLTAGINVDLTMEEAGGITVKEYSHAPNVKTVFTNTEEASNDN